LFELKTIQTINNKYPLKKELKLFQKIVLELLKEEKKNPTIKPIHSNEIWKRLDLKLEDYPISESEFEIILRELVLSTPRTCTRTFFNQLYGGRNPKATLGDLLTVILNSSMYTYKVAGIQVGVEKEIVNRIIQLIDFPKTSSGTFTSGGSMSNLLAMLMARDRFEPDIIHKGMRKTILLYTSEASHYSIKKNASILGLGKNNVRIIPVNEKGRMIPEQLEQAIIDDTKNKRRPFFINATAGTTVLGAFDPIDKLAEIAKKYNIWLHVDGAYSGGVIFSDKYKHLIKGLEEVDSFVLNAHKMMGVPLTCSILLTKHKKQLLKSLSEDANYLYQTEDDDYNLGKSSLQCGRRNNALKFWTLWKSVGKRGLEIIVNKQFLLADIARDYISDHPDYTLYSFDDSLSVCFNYKNISAESLCNSLYENGELMVGFGSFSGKTFIRLVTINYGNSKEDIFDFFKILEKNVARNPSLTKNIILQK
jgi:sulfinoalanine decarboxylase/sulfinoalanine decarboxylase/aspartate 1-decarboxylase